MKQLFVKKLIFYINSSLLLPLILNCLQTHALITRLPCVYYGEFQILENRYKIGSIVQTIASASKSDCVTSCITRNDCLLVNYNKIDYSCQLLSSITDEVLDRNFDSLITALESNSNAKKVFFLSNLSPSKLFH